jgi:hypothetical protein
MSRLCRADTVIARCGFLTASAQMPQAWQGRAIARAFRRDKPGAMRIEDRKRWL